MKGGRGKQVAGKAPAAAAASFPGKRKTAASEDPGGSGKRRRRPGVLQFFDDAAVDADSDYENGEDREMEEATATLDSTDNGMSENKNVVGVGKAHHLPLFVKEELSGDELEELIKDRYDNGSEYVVYNDDSAECDDKVSEADGTKGVIIWRVKCMVGRERQMAFCFMQKYVELDNLGTKLQIISAFALEHVKGYVFVEADKLSDVTEACKGFCNIYSSRINIVPRSEIPHLLASRNKLSDVSKGKWVRMKSGKYKGDLAQVVAVDDGRNQVTIKLVPRIDLQAIAKKFGGGVSLKLAAVPAPRLISSHELETFRPHIEVRRDRQTGELFEVLDGMMLKDGYLYKKVSVGSVIFWGVQPSSSELLMFSDATNNMDEDLNWVSSIYNARKKKPLVEASDDKVSAVSKSGYSLHDLVLFGRKHFGVIVAVEKDCFKILRGDTEGAEVVTVKIQDIKNSCVDKMFTALDRNRKTIFINDIVKIFIGPLEGREGVVKHMYKGTLFIRVEDETENSGFCCTKSESCEKTKESKASYGAKVGQGKESKPSFAQSPIRTFDQEDNAHGSSWRRRSNDDQMFSIGQTLRIREGPLKGYLCRVVGIYRSDVTVKLDSLVKLITVKDKSLAVPKIKGDNSTTISSDQTGRSPDHFGTREMLSIACPSIGETSTQAEKSSWDSVIPSFGRDSWQPFSTSNFSVACNNENQTEGCEDDPWGNKVVSVARVSAGDSDKATDDWGKQPGSSTDQGHEADPWGNMVTSAAQQATGGSNETIDGWGKATGSFTGRGLGADPWSSKATSADRTDACGSVGTMGGWGKPSNSGALAKDFNGASDRAGNSEILSDDWSDKTSVEKNTGIDGWEKSKLSVSDAGGSWDREIVKNNSQCFWDTKGKGKINSKEDAWGKAAKSQEKSNDSWDAAGVGRTQSNNNTCSWDNKGERKINTEEDAWGKAAKLQEKSNDRRDAGATGWSHATLNHGCELGSWNNGKGPSASQSDNWVKEKEKNEAETGKSSEARVSSLGQDGSWDRRMSPRGNHESRWNKGKDIEGADANDQMNCNKPRNFQGARGLNVDDNENRSQGGWNKNRDWGQTSSWEKGREQDDEVGGHRNHENNWSRQREFDGASGSSRGRGRGRRAPRGGMGHDAGDQDWSSGRGVGRGRGRGGGRGHYGDAGGRGDGYDETRPFGQVHNWDKGHSTTEASDWKNQQNSEDPSSNWANDKNAGWDKLKNLSGNEGASGNTDQMGAWSKNKSFDGHCSARNSFSQDADGRMDAKGVDHASSWGKGVSFPGGSNNWGKPHTGEWSECSKDDTNKWSTTSFKDAPGAQDNLHISGPRSFIGNNQNTSNVNEGGKPGWDKWSSGNEDNAAGGSGWNSAKASYAKQLSGRSVWADCSSTGVEAGDKKIRGVWDRPRADEPYKNSKVGAGISSGEGATICDEKGKDVSLDKSSNWTHPEVVSGAKVDAGDIKGKRTIADGHWDTTTNSQEKKLDEAINWGDNSRQSKEVSTLKGGSESGSWDAAVLRMTQSAMECSSQVSSWEKAKNPCAGQSEESKNSQTNDAEGGGWNQAGSFKRSENDNWDRPKLFGEQAGRGDQIDSWNKNREGGHGFGRGRGRGRNSWDRGNNCHDSSWNKQVEHGEDQRSSWGRGRGGNDEAGGDQQGKWKREGDFDGGRGSSWGRGRGRFGTRDRSQGDNSDGPPNQERNWGGRGRGWGRDGGNNFDSGRPFNRGGGRGPGRGRFFSSDRKNDEDNFGSGTSLRNPVSSWGNDEKPGWGRSEGQASAEFGGKIDQQVGGSKDKSLGGDSSSWGNRSSNWSKVEADISSNSNKEQNNCGRTKEFGGSQSSAWDDWSTKTEGVGKAAGACSNSKDAQDAGDQGCSWDKAAGALGKNDDGSGSKGGW